MIIITDKRCLDYHRPGHPERPQRVGATVELLRKQADVPLDWKEPDEVDPGTLFNAHTPEHANTVLEAANDFDSDTPAYPGIYDHALRSVGGAMKAMTLAREGKTAFSLLRPPGHHATRLRAMGFCYFSTMAITILRAQELGVKRLAVFDFDVHHGNGTEDILRDRNDIAFYSVHQSPCYPGTGTTNVGSNCFNFTFPPEAPREDYRRLLRRALDELLAFKPDLIGVSAGFDGYVGDPLAQGTLERDDFRWLGEQLRESGVPFFSILEGGYSDELPELILAYLQGVTG